MASNLSFQTNIAWIVPKGLESFTRQVAKIAMTASSEERTLDFTRQNLNILEPKQKKNIYKLLLITSKPRDMIKNVITL